MKKDIIIPREGGNDETCFLTWEVADGDFVISGQVVAVIETTKTSIDISAKMDGYITLYTEGDIDVAVGTLIATITEEQSAPPATHQFLDIRENETDGQLITKKARTFIEQHGIDLDQISAKGIIREKDVVVLLNQQKDQPAQVRENSLLIYGGGGFARIIIDIVRQIGIFSIKGIIDVQYPLLEPVMGVSVIGADASLDTLLNEGVVNIVNAVGVYPTSTGRLHVFKKLCKKGFIFPNVIHPRAIIEPSVILGQGNLICAGAIIGSKVNIGNNCIINAGSVISHDSIIADGCHIASGALIAGNVVVGKNTLIGQGCTTYQNIRIGDNVTVYNGANLFKSIPDGSIIRQ